MKVVLVFLAAVVVLNASELPEFLKELGPRLRKICVGKTGVDDALIDKCMDGEFAEDDKLKCYFKCLYVETGMLKDDETIDVERVVNSLPEEYQKLWEATIRKCDTIVGKDACESAFLTHKCYYAELPEVYLVV